MNCAENPFKMGMFLQLEVSFKMGVFSDTQHTHPGIFILESPPWASGLHSLIDECNNMPRGVPALV